MTRHGKRGGDGASWEQTSPPWELPGWEEEASLPPGHPSRPLPGQPRAGHYTDDLAHPSGPLPRVSTGPLPAVSPWSEPGDASPGETSGPLAPLPEADHEDWVGQLRGDPAPGYGRRHDSGGQPRGYDTPGYPGPGYGGGYGEDRYPAADPYRQGGPPGGDYPAQARYRGYPGDAGYPEDGGYPGGGYADDEGYAPGEGYSSHGYPGEAGYAEAGYAGGDFAGEDDYQAWEPSAAPPGERGGEHGYGDPGDWYGDVDDDQDWADDGYGDGFLPGIGDSSTRVGRDAGRDRAPQARPVRRKGKRKGGFRRAAPWIALSVLVVLLAVGGGGYLYVYRTYLHPPDYSGAGTGTVEIQIKPGDTATAVGQTLLAKGVVASVRAFANAARTSGRGSALEPGYYRLHLHMSAALAFKLLLTPSARIQTKVTIPEGLRLSNIIALLGKATGDLAGYKQAVKQRSQLGLPTFAKGNPQGFLFPATYPIQPGTTPLKVLQQMVLTFDQQVASLQLTTTAAHDFLTPRQVIIVASLLEAEGGRISDYPKIAGVIYNRLNQGMPLQLDSTVLFALHKYGILASAADLRYKSPYNTYLHKGLPPGPIDSPGAAAIKAALHPLHNSWTYFVTVDPKTGLTKFTSSFAQFQQYQAQLRTYLATHH
jgi:peptidoglycan lytic transglycosylase G